MKSLIGDKKFYRMVLIVCIPIVIQNGFTNLASLLDNEWCIYFKSVISSGENSIACCGDESHFLYCLMRIKSI